jgi:hypothetical protein
MIFVLEGPHRIAAILPIDRQDGVTARAICGKAPGRWKL